MPFDSGHILHSHFVMLDEEIQAYEKRGDIFCPPGSLKAAVVQFDDGLIICYLRFHPRNWNWLDALDEKEVQEHIWKTVSHDDCRTFSPPVATNLRNPGSGIDIALNRSGRLLITYNDSYALRLPLSVGISNAPGRDVPRSGY